jgi:1,4-dihydroxy-6-naphthoate synthase
MKQSIKIAHSPDSDDAFMFYAIKEAKVNLKDYQFEFSSDEIDILNMEAINNEFKYDIFAVSFHAYAKLRDKFQILNSGASMGGKDYGPKLVTNKNLSILDLQNFSQLKIAVPGKLTSAFLVLKEWLKENNIKADYVFCSYNEVFKLLDQEKVEASLLIHEAQLRYQELGYRLIVDLGIWWYEKHSGLNMPLGCNVIRKDLGTKVINDIESILKESIVWGLNNFEEVLAYSRNFANNQLNDEKAKLYIEMYVNDSTVELSTKDHESINKLLSLVTS